MRPDDPKGPSFPLDHWNHLYGMPVGTARIRTFPRDFVVEEQLGFSPQGAGPHHWLHIRYHSVNTVDLAAMLAGAADVHPKDVGFSGLKDRNAVKSQWFSLPRPSPDSGIPESVVNLCKEDERIEWFHVSANSRKLRRGVHAGNRFTLTLREVSVSRTEFETRLAAIRCTGIPNYFGPQRFGRGGSNISTAVGLSQDAIPNPRRRVRSMALSAARSWVFNEVLSRRIQRWDWNHILDGDIIQLNRSRSHFLHDGTDNTVTDRIERGELHITGPLWGRGRLPVAAEANSFEEEVVNCIPLFPDWLCSSGLKQERRAVRVIPTDMHCRFEGDDQLVIGFDLPKGSFATAVLRELIQTESQF